MPEIRDMNVKQADERCPVCGNGWMRPTGIVLTSQPPHFEHKCNACDYKQNYTVRYPYVIGS
jgi:hypothetical protein